MSVYMTDLGVSLSIKQALTYSLGMNVIMRSDDMTYPEEKPFIIVTSLENVNTAVSKARETMNTLYRYQVEVYAESFSNMSEIQNVISDLFMFERITYFTHKGAKTKRTFTVKEDFNEVPLFSDDITDETKSNVLYFDIGVDVAKHKNNKIRR